MDSHDSDESKLNEVERAQQDASFRYFNRFHRIVILVILVITLAIVALWPSIPRFAGLVIVMAFTGVSLLSGRFSLRVLGFGCLAVAGVLCIVAELAGPEWPMQRPEFAIMAISSGVLGLGLVFTSNRTGEPDPRFEQIAGVLAMLGLLGITTFVTWRGAGHTGTWVTAEGVAALVDSANRKWKSRLFLIAALPMFAIVADLAQPAWLVAVKHFVKISLTTLVAWPNYPVPVSGLLFALVCLFRRPRLPWRAIFLGVVFVICVAYMIRTILLIANGDCATHVC
jgi:hypothetical protein